MKLDSESLLAAFAENLPGAAFHYALDADNNESIRFLNSGCENIWGVSAQDIGSDPGPLWDMVHTDDLKTMQSSVGLSAEHLSLWEARFRIIDGSGTEKTLLSRGTPKRLPCGGTSWLTFLFDVTSQMRTERLFEVVSHQLNYISSAIPDGFALFDARHRLVVCNQIFRDLYCIGKARDIKDTAYREIVESAVGHQVIPGAVGREAGWVAEEVRHFQNAGGKREERWSGARWIKMVDRPTEDGGRVVFRIDTTETVKRKNELERAASTDALTGLLNRRGLGVLLPEASAGLKDGERISVLQIDLDRFKAVNDAYGHEAGDHVLTRTARRLEEFTDDGTHIARVGGDEFALVQISRRSDAETYKLAEKLRQSIIRPFSFNGRLCHVGASVGIATWEKGVSEALEQTLMDADTAMLHGKTLGRNQTAVFRKDMRLAAVRTASVASQIKEGINRNAFEPFFQPQLSFPGGEITGLESLARWKKQDGSYAAASSFIDLANETGLISEIDQMVLRGSLNVLRDLPRHGIRHPRLSINLSCLQLATDDIVERLLDELFVRNLSADQLNIEVLETTLLDDRIDKAGRNIRALADAGFRIELDDFGTGHTALASLTRFPVHQIKVDRSLIQNIDSQPKKRAITGGLFLVCRQLGIEAIAEGVETEAEKAVLMDLGYTLFQGFLFAKPMPAARLFGWIADRNGKDNERPGSQQI